MISKESIGFTTASQFESISEHEYRQQKRQFSKKATDADKRHYKTIAKELKYKKEIIEMIDNAETIAECDAALVKGRTCGG